MMLLRIKYLTVAFARVAYLRLPVKLRLRLLFALLGLGRSDVVVPLLAVDPHRAAMRLTLERHIRARLGDDLHLTPHGVGKPLSQRLSQDEQSRVLAEIALIMNEACSAAGVSDWWICYGTLLGFIRDGALLPSDDDFDVAYLSQGAGETEIIHERRAVLAALRAASGVSAVDARGGMFTVSVDRGGVPAFEFDLFTAYQTERGMEMFMAPPGIAQIDWILPTQQRDVLNTTVSIPNNSEAVLAWLYGKDWSTPDPSYRARWFWPEHDFLRRGKLS